MTIENKKQEEMLEELKRNGNITGRDIGEYVIG